MQNNVTELTQKLLRSVDSSYNVIDMPVVVEVISVLERMHITKELLEATRLGKHINELRRKATTESLQKRSKELVKRWRRLLFPSNGQLSQTPPKTEEPASTPPPGGGRKRPPPDNPPGAPTKRPRVNGSSELDFSDNSNSSFKETSSKPEADRLVILINSDSNSSLNDARHDPLLDQQQPKKRGRKKGSKNHRNLLDEAETSFTNKMAVSRGNAKVKTTQELVASLQNRSGGGNPLSPGTSNAAAAARPIDNLMERAAKLTERVSIIDQKLNTNANRKNSQRKFVKSSGEARSERVIESGVVVNITNAAEDEIIVVDDVEHETNRESNPDDSKRADSPSEVAPDAPKSYSIEEALALLPPIDHTTLDDVEPEPACSCILKEHKSTGFSMEDPDSEDEDRIEFVEDCNCEARGHFESKYLKLDASEARARELSEQCLPSVNGNFSMGSDKPGVAPVDGLFADVVPDARAEALPRNLGGPGFDGENYKRYSISDCKSAAGDRTGGLDTFREFHEVVELPSYNGEAFRILPYVVID